MTGIDFHEALLDPATVFDTPEDVVREASLSNPEKAEILRRWQYNIAEEDVALEEGMQGSETGMMRRVMLALQQVVGDLEISRDGPSKQHGLRRSKGK